MARKLTRSQADRIARSWRIQASRLYARMVDERLDDETRDHIRTAHDGLCQAFRSIERVNKVY